VKAPDLLTISIVTYFVEADAFARTLRQLKSALEHLVSQYSGSFAVSIVDNGNQVELLRNQLERAGLAQQATLRDAGSNLGYGKAHNLVIGSANSRYHLIMNPDVEMAPDTLLNAVTFMEQHRDVVALSPHAEDGAGQDAYLCKRYPAIFDLALRGFAPRIVKQRFSKRLGVYENRSLVASKQPAPVDVISGCFMFCRTSALQKAGGFDPAFFLYFEDFSLSLELGKLGKLMYCPTSHIVHYGGNAGKKGLRHIVHFVASAFRFYNHYGWKLL
jgi:GT2 family glycosyltransferase